MYSILLRALRKFSVKLKKLPGAIFLLNPIRKVFAKSRSCVVVDDYDGSMTMRLCLSEHMQSSIFWYGYYSRDIILLLNKLLKPGMTVFDVGANVGEITLASSRRVGVTGSVYAFEPLPMLYEELNINIDSNCLTQVTALKIGISQFSGRTQIYKTSADFRDGTTHAGLGTLYASDVRGTPFGEIQLRSLDEVVKEMNIERVDLIKIDIEGAELPALKGASYTIKRFKPYLIIEIQYETADQAGYKAGEILDLLDRCGYKFFSIGRKAKLVPLTVNTLKPFQNVFCVHSCNSLMF